MDVIQGNIGYSLSGRSLSRMSLAVPVHLGCSLSISHNVLILRCFGSVGGIDPVGSCLRAVWR